MFMSGLDKSNFENILAQLGNELSKLRTGRANPSLLEDLKVDYYGTAMPVKQLASVSVPEPRQLLVQPWDKNALQPMEKAIRDAGLGFNPTNEGDKLRITLPELNQERRLELGKLIRKIAEDARVKVRNSREEIMRGIKILENEDERFRQQEQMQKLVDEYNQKIKTLAEAKEKEMMTV